MNVILNPDNTLKNIVSVDERTARNAGCPVDILPEDIFIGNAPVVPDNLIVPKFSSEGVWVEGATATQILNNDLITLNNKLTDIEVTIDSYISKVARSKGYNSIESCLSYIGDSNIQWSAEASAFKIWRTQCWEYVIQEQQKIRDGLRTIPTPEEAVLELPPMVWPV